MPPKVGAGFLLWQERPRVMGGARRGDGDTPVFSGAASHSFRPAGIAGLPVIKFKFSPKQEGLGQGQAGPVAVDKAAPAPFFTVILFVKIGGVEHKKRPNGRKRSGIMDAKKISYLTRKELVRC